MIFSFRINRVIIFMVSMVFLSSLVILLIGCRSKFNYVKGTQKPAQYIDQALKIRVSADQVFTNNHPQSSVTFFADCSLPGDTLIKWNFNDNSEKKYGSMVIHSFKYAGNYIIKVDCTNNQKMSSSAETIIQVTFKDHPENSNSENNTSNTFDDTLNCIPYLDTEVNQIKFRCRDEQEVGEDTNTTTSNNIGGVLSVQSSHYQIAYNPNPKTAVKLDAQCSLTGDNVTLQWDLGDQSSKKHGATIFHHYQAKGQYTVTITCEDSSSGKKAQSQMIIVVN